jgi:hypothetical protein
VAFTVLPPRPFGEAYRHFDNHVQLQETGDHYTAKLSLISELPQEGTIVYAELFRHLQYYLPQYHTFLPPDLRRSSPGVVNSVVSVRNGNMEYGNDVEVQDLIPADTRRIVSYDLQPETILVDRALVEKRSKNGHSIEVITIPDDYSALWTLDGLLVEARE